MLLLAAATRRSGSCFAKSLIRDQVFDEEKNKVMITVVCCDPEKMRDKLCCKGGKAIQSIEIPQPKPPPPMPKLHPPKISTQNTPTTEDSYA
ncbi:hypothetical protein E3N88_37268 [Mikania micrantha]|uniref:Uncharacterized protein n=1 Tax=Mikania micrantha TaxID=192012 RepID=A0A5N6LDG1_9ASTR|nr:hypothetical protein E3N88_43951 [Mikania micrantha]KAD3069388.1 hypothetical protein E3N88_37268 [Mikania micrantha]